MSSFRHANNRVNYRKKLKRKALFNAPQRKGTCVKVFKMAPKKPCSAKRSVTFAKLTNGKYILCKIPGEEHNLRKFSNVLIRGGRALDTPGCKYRIIASQTGNSDLKPPPKRKTARSKFGIKNEKLKRHLRLESRPTRRPVRPLLEWSFMDDEDGLEVMYFSRRRAVNEILRGINRLPKTYFRTAEQYDLELKEEKPAQLTQAVPSAFVPQRVGDWYARAPKIH